MHQKYTDKKDIFLAGVKRVDPYSLVRSFLRVAGSDLVVLDNNSRKTLPIHQNTRIFVIGAGKASAKMAQAVEHILGDRISGGVISVKYGYVEPLERIRLIEADHPIPDKNSVDSSRMIMEIARKANENDIVINLISGGGSALMAYPFNFPEKLSLPALNLAEKQKTNEILISCGANINEINCIRKHISAIKGGKLAEAIHPATSISLILSDVVGDRLDVIASGPTSPDNSTFRDMKKIIEKYDISQKLPRKVLDILHLGLTGHIPETPKKGNPVFRKSICRIIGSNSLAVEAAAKKAKALGYKTKVLSSMITGEAREVTKVLIAVGKETIRRKTAGDSPGCIISGGETTVTIRGKGKGGRNQEMALAFLLEMESNREQTRGLSFLAASTDGNDGPTDSAGAFAGIEFLDLANKKHLDIDRYLRDNDSWTFFESLGGHLKTGPTNTNVCDLHILLVNNAGLPALK